MKVNSNIKICVAISTFNGSKYINTQLNSIFNDFPAIKFFIRDDASTDNTCKIIENFFEDKKESLKYFECGNENVGVIRSFSLLLSSIKDFDYIFLSDQDDCWIFGRTQLYLNYLSKIDTNCLQNKPICLFSDSIITDEYLNIINYSFWKMDKNFPSVKNKLNHYLLQNPAPGCTMLINNKMLDYLKDIPLNVIMHDWWILLIAECFGLATFINKPTLLYRQHANNTVGVNNLSFINSLINFKNLIKKSKLKLNNSFLQAAVFLYSFDNIPNEKKIIIKNFIEIKNYHFPKKQFFMIKNKYLKSSFIRTAITLLVV